MDISQVIKLLTRLGLYIAQRSQQSLLPINTKCQLEKLEKKKKKIDGVDHHGSNKTGAASLQISIVWFDIRMNIILVKRKLRVLLFLNKPALLLKKEFNRNSLQEIIFLAPHS